MISIAVAIVIYNKKVSDSITYKNLRVIEDNKVVVLIVDNSECDMGNEEYCGKNGIRYLSMKGNAGLSKAYNAAVDASLDKDILVLLDDDTEVTEEYFKSLEKAAEARRSADIFAPIIYGQDGVIYSPNEYNFLKNRLITSPDQEVRQEHFNAIGSCLAIRMRIFKNYRFNEKLFVDQVDQNFFCDQRRLGAEFAKLDVQIVQHFHQREATLTPEAGWGRLRQRIVDIMRQTRLIGGIKIRILGYIKCCGLGVQIGKKSKSVMVVSKAVALSTKLVFIEQ